MISETACFALFYFYQKVKVKCAKGCGDVFRGRALACHSQGSKKQMGAKALSCNPCMYVGKQGKFKTSLQANRKMSRNELSDVKL